MDRRLIGLVGGLLLWTAPALAQGPHADVVTAVKADLQARGVDLAGPCGAYKIVVRSAWRLRAEGAGTLEKLTGNQCESRATDVVAYPSGRLFDVLTDG